MGDGAQEDVYSDNEREPWRRKMLRSRKSDTNSRFKLREEYEDFIDRIKELAEESKKEPTHNSKNIPHITKKSDIMFKTSSNVNDANQQNTDTSPTVRTSPAESF